VHGIQALSGVSQAATGLAVDGNESLDLRSSEVATSAIQFWKQS